MSGIPPIKTLGGEHAQTKYQVPGNVGRGRTESIAEPGSHWKNGGLPGTTRSDFACAGRNTGERIVDR